MLGFREFLQVVEADASGEDEFAKPKKKKKKKKGFLPKIPRMGAGKTTVKSGKFVYGAPGKI